MKFFHKPCLRLATLLLLPFTAGCAFLPGFSLFESPTLYYIPVAEVANQVSCELQEFMREHKSDKAYANHKWVLSDDDVKVVLTLTTDEQGSVNFAGINAAQLGLSSLQALIANNAKVSSLAAKLQVKRTKSVAMTFSVAPSALRKDLVQTADMRVMSRTCANFSTENRLTKLYLKDWLNNYFEVINSGYENPNAPYKNESATELLLHKILRPISPPPEVPKQFKIQSVGIATSIALVADVNAGLNQQVLGNGSTYIVPINGLGVDYNPDYVHKIELTLNVCQRDDRTSCNLADQSIATLNKQCAQYGLLNPLMPVTPPKDYELAGQQYRCTRDGKYLPVS